MLYLLALVLSFGTVFVKGFQYKNVNGNHKKMVIFTSYLMALGDVLTVGLIIKSDWTIAVATGTGGAIGMVLSMIFHDKLFNK